MQKEIVLSVLNGRDTLALLATGGGKSITYQVPAMMQEGICLVISPLIALMQDQLQGLLSKGIKAVSLNSFMSKKEIDIALDNCIYGDFKFLFISPERLKSSLFIERLKKMNVNFITVDEAHCISQWGHDFRPDYLNISRIREFHQCPILALTATATTHVIKDIQNQLVFKDGNVLKGTFERKNLSFNVIQSQDKMKDVVYLLENKEQVAIVYTRSRADTAKISSFLNNNGITARHYHAGISQSERKEIQQNWMDEKFKVIVATNAFGMGIDKSNVRRVIHYSICDNPEAYFQEAGRAGRDQQNADVFLLYNEDDLVTAQYRFEQNHPSPEFIREIYHNLNMNYQLAIGSGAEEKYPFDLRTFCKKYDVPMMKTYAALSCLALNDHILLNESFHQPSTLQLTIERSGVENFIQSNPVLGKLLAVVLRSYTHLFSQEVRIKESELTSRSGLDFFQIQNKLKQMDEMGIIKYHPSHDQSMILFYKERVDKKYLSLNVKTLRSRKAQAAQKLKAIINYVRNEHICRSLLLLHYFSENPGKNCGKCDNCNRSQLISYPKLQSFKEIIMTEVREAKVDVSSVLKGDYGLSQDEMKSALRWVIDEGVIRIDDGRLSLNI